MQIPTHHFLFLLTLFTLSACSGSSANTSPDYEKEGSQDLFANDRDIPRRVRKVKPAVVQPEMVIPQAVKEPSMEIDGKQDGWKKDDFKVFAAPNNVEMGKAYWKGPKDASLRVGVRTDGNFVYFWLEVKDDTVVLKDNAKGIPTDGIVLYLADPRLKDILNALPSDLRSGKDVVGETAIVFNPQGRTRLYPSNSTNYPDGSILTESIKTEQGYGVEVAIKAELLPNVSSFPMENIAFRVEQLDGDEPKRPGTQTRISMFPAKRGEQERMARAQVNLLPHRKIKAAPVRPDALGFWSRDETSWSYTSFEAMTKSWFHLPDTTKLKAAIKGQAKFDSVCNPAQYNAVVMESYASRTGANQAGLVMCSARDVEGKCPDSSTSKVFWVQAKRKADAWEIVRAVDVFPKALPQCTTQAVAGELMRSNFSLLPMHVLGNNVWAVGWQEKQNLEDYRWDARKIALFQTHTKPTMIAELTPSKILAEQDSRSMSTAHTYLIDVDAEEGLDICEIEDVNEQSCRRFDAQCKTREHGQSRLTHVKLWSDEKDTFVSHLMSKHKGCPHGLKFKDTSGYMLTYLGDRIGLIPSPALSGSSKSKSKSTKKNPFDE
jgi:hypothetical protein